MRKSIGFFLVVFIYFCGFAAVLSGDSFNFATVGRNGTGVYSNDGGKTWAISRIPDKGIYINGIVSDYLGAFYAVASKGKLLVSRDGGASYTIRQLDTELQLFGITHDGRGHFVIVAVGDTILISDDYAQSWQMIETNFETNYKKVITDKQGAWIAVGTGGIVALSKDNGMSWNKVHESPLKSHRNDIAFDGKNSFVAVGASGYINISEDNGASWEDYQIIDDKQKPYLESIVWNNNGRFIAAGWNGKVFTSSGDTKNWEKTELGAEKRFLKSSTNGGSKIIMVGFKGLIMVSTDSGKTWIQKQLKSATKHLHDVAYNHLPDLVPAAIGANDKCQLTLTLVNRGTVGVPESVWEKPDEYVIEVLRENKIIFSITIATVDTAGLLKTAGGSVSITLPVTVLKDDKLIIKIDSMNKLRESSTSNNIKESELTCPAL